MPINNITQTISTIPEAGRRGIDVQTQFVIKQEDFQDHLQGITVTELNTLKDQLNSRIGEINSTATTMDGYANTASTGALTATTKAGEASTSASGALTSRNQAETFKNNASASATKASQWADNNYNVEVETGKYSAKHWATVAENFGGDTVKLTGNQTVDGVKTFSSNIVGSITGNSATATKLNTARTINGVAFDGSVNITVSDSTAVKLTGNQTVDGVKTFSSFPIMPSSAPTTNYQVANKKYVDDRIVASSETISGIIELATTAEAQAGTDDTRAITPLKLKNSVLGLGQTLQVFTVGTTRIAGTNYTNSTGKPIWIIVAMTPGAGASLSVTAGGALRTFSVPDNGSPTRVIVPILNGESYSATTSVGTINYWAEIR